MYLKVFGKNIPVKKIDLSKADNDAHYDLKSQSINVHKKLKGDELDRILVHN